MKSAKAFGFKAVGVRFDVYDYEFQVIFGKPDNVVAYVASRLGIASWDHPGNHRGMTYLRSGMAPIVWMPRPPRTPNELGTLSHELMHVVAAMLVGKGMGLTNASDEAFAYAMGYAVRRVLEQVR